LSALSKHLIPISEDNISFAAAFIFKCELIISLNNLVYQLAVLMNQRVIGLFENMEMKRWALQEDNRFEVISEKKLKNISIEKIISTADRMVRGKQA